MFYLLYQNFCNLLILLFSAYLSLALLYYFNRSRSIQGLVTHKLYGRLGCYVPGAWVWATFNSKGLIWDPSQPESNPRLPPAKYYQLDCRRSLHNQYGLGGGTITSHMRNGGHCNYIAPFGAIIHIYTTSVNTVGRLNLL